MEYLTINRLGVLFEYQFTSQKLLLVAVVANWMALGLGKIIGGLAVVYGVSSIVFTFEGLSPAVLSGGVQVFSAGGTFVVLGLAVFFVGHIVASVVTEGLWRLDSRIDESDGII